MSPSKQGAAHQPGKRESFKHFILTKPCVCCAHGGWNRQGVTLCSLPGSLQFGLVKLTSSGLAEVSTPSQPPCGERAVLPQVSMKLEGSGKGGTTHTTLSDQARNKVFQVRAAPSYPCPHSWAGCHGYSPSCILLLPWKEACHSRASKI